MEPTVVETVGTPAPLGEGPLERLDGEITVISPHLDDAVLSLGAAIASASRRGARVRVVTVFGKDPSSTAPAGPWDASCGFRSAGEAATVRRAEDRIACGIVGAEPVWLPFTTSEDAGGRQVDVVAAIAETIAPGDSVLVPGFPLILPEHAFCTRLALEAAASTRVLRVGLYVEQPYAMWEVVGARSGLRRAALRLAQAVRSDAARSRQAPSSPLDVWLGGRLVWQAESTQARDRASKRRAIRAYRSQFPGLGRALVAQIALYEWSWGGEGVAWIGCRGACASGAAGP